MYVYLNAKMSKVSSYNRSILVLNIYVCCCPETHMHIIGLILVADRIETQSQCDITVKKVVH